MKWQVIFTRLESNHLLKSPVTACAVSRTIFCVNELVSRVWLECEICSRLQVLRCIESQPFSYGVLNGSLMGLLFSRLYLLGKKIHVRTSVLALKRPFRVLWCFPIQKFYIFHSGTFRWNANSLALTSELQRHWVLGSVILAYITDALQRFPYLLSLFTPVAMVFAFGRVETLRIDAIARRSFVGSSGLCSLLMSSSKTRKSLSTKTAHPSTIRKLRFGHGTSRLHNRLKFSPGLIKKDRRTQTKKKQINAEKASKAAHVLFQIRTPAGATKNLYLEIFFIIFVVDPKQREEFFKNDRSNFRSNAKRTVCFPAAHISHTAECIAWWKS